MSFDIFLQCYRNGEPATFKRSIVEEILGPYAVEREPRFMRVRFPDGSGGDVYVGDEEDIQHMMFNYCGGDMFFAALHALAARTESVIFWPLTPPSTAVTDEAASQHLSSDFLDGLGPAKVVRNGQELEAYIFRRNW